MAKETASRKRRTREHVIADLSVNHVELFALRVGFTVQRHHQDYGIDLQVSTFSKEGELEHGLVYFQVKATDHLSRMRHGKSISFVVDERDLQGWLMQSHPVILVVFDAQSNRAYWAHIQAYFERIWNESGVSIKAYRTIHIPVKNRLNEKAMMKFAEEKNNMYENGKGWSAYGKQTHYVR